MIKAVLGLSLERTLQAAADGLLVRLEHLRPFGILGRQEVLRGLLIDGKMDVLSDGGSVFPSRMFYFPAAFCLSLAKARS